MQMGRGASGPDEEDLAKWKQEKGGRTILDQRRLRKMQKVKCPSGHTRQKKKGNNVKRENVLPDNTRPKNTSQNAMSEGPAGP